MNYKIINDVAILSNFINWLPAPELNEIYYVCLFARKKYCTLMQEIKTDKWQLKRFTSKRHDLLKKIQQLECPVGAYTMKGIEIPQEALAVYISVNPRDLERAAKNSLIKLANLITSEYNGYNVHQEVMSEIHRSCSRKVYLDFDFDKVELEPTIEMVKQAVNIDCVKVLQTHGGFHVLVEVKNIHQDYQKSWYEKMTEIPGMDVRGDVLLPVPGCTQGNFTPKFIDIE